MRCALSCKGMGRMELGLSRPNRWSSVGGLNSAKLHNQIFCLIGNYI